MIGLNAAALLRNLLDGLKANTYESMDRIAGGWSPDGHLPSATGARPMKRSFVLNFPAHKRKRMSWIRQACGQGH